MGRPNGAATRARGACQRDPAVSCLIKNAEAVREGGRWIKRGSDGRRASPSRDEFRRGLTLETAGEGRSGHLQACCDSGEAGKRSRMIRHVEEASQRLLRLHPVVAELRQQLGGYRQN